MSIELRQVQGKASACCGAPAWTLSGMPQLVCGECRCHCQVRPAEQEDIMTPEEAGNFYEEDEDPAEVFAWFDSEHDYPVPPTRAGRWFFVQCERHGWLYCLTLPYWMARCRWLGRRTS